MEKNEIYAQANKVSLGIEKNLRAIRKRSLSYLSTGEQYSDMDLLLDDIEKMVVSQTSFPYWEDNTVCEDLLEGVSILKKVSFHNKPLVVDSLLTTKIVPLRSFLGKKLANLN